jgi:hypothetical protein
MPLLLLVACICTAGSGAVALAPLAFPNMA